MDTRNTAFNPIAAAERLCELNDIAGEQGGDYTDAQQCEAMELHTDFQNWIGGDGYAEVEPLYGAQWRMVGVQVTHGSYSVKVEVR